MKTRLPWILAFAAIAIAVVYLANRRRAGDANVTSAPPAPPPPAPKQFYPPASPPPPVRTPNATPVTAEPAPATSTPAANPPPATQPAAPGTGPASTSPPARSTATMPAETPATETPPDETAAATTALETVGMRVREYSLRFDGNPTGTNAEITAALTGKNPKSVRFLSGGDLRMNDDGELIDQWSTPYFFHALSKDEMETRSAGPDKILWTDDDLVTR